MQATHSKEKIRTPLVAKIGAWVLIHLFLLVALSLLVFQTQFRFGLDALLAGPAGERVHALTQAVLGTLRVTPLEEWDEVLSNFGSAYNVEFTLVGPDGFRIAGALASLPEPVLSRIVERRGPPEVFGRGPPAGKGPRRGRLDLDSPRALMAQPQFALKTDAPRRYWVALRLPPIPSPENALQVPMAGPWTLLLATDSLYKGGLFLDVRIWLFTGAVVLLISAMLWIPLVRGLTKAISELTRATNEIASGNFSVRVPDNRRDELGQLGTSVNRMADRLDGFVQGQKRFLGDTAHELCSPLARMQMALGILDQTASAGQSDAIRDLREDVDEMSALVNELLSFSKASLAGTSSPMERIRLRDIVHEAARRENDPPNPIKLHISESAAVMGRADLLRRALSNLIRNAVRYAGAHGPITVSEETDGGWVCVRVRDMGPGVDEGELQRIFDPFYRTEQSRSRETGGVGLGLAIVKTCVEACGGSVSAANKSPGLEVTLRLPSAESADQASDQ